MSRFLLSLGFSAKKSANLRNADHANVLQSLRAAGKAIEMHANKGYIACMEDVMPTLQVRDLPEDIYTQIKYLAEKEHRSLAQETIVLLQEGITKRLQNKERRRKLLEEISNLDIDGNKYPDPVELIREDRER
jgi:plasmid stability protein